MPTAGQIIRAADFTPAEVDVQNTSGTTTSTTATETLTSGTACSTTFVAPTSGKVQVSITSRIANSSTSITYCGYIIRAGGVIGSGTTFEAADDGRAILHEEGANVFSRKTVTRVVEGLTAGDTYNIRMWFRVVGNTGSYANKELSVVPLPA